VRKSELVGREGYGSLNCAVVCIVYVGTKVFVEELYGTVSSCGGTRFVAGWIRVDFWCPSSEKKDIESFGDRVTEEEYWALTKKG